MIRHFLSVLLLVFASFLADAQCNLFSFSNTQAGNTVSYTPSVPPGFTVSGYTWSFGDGGNSNLANPTYTYAAGGWYYVCMMVWGYNPNQVIFQCNICDSVFVGNGGNPLCSATFVNNVVGPVASFMSTATGPGVITSYSWTFGDGGTSNLMNPTHTYANTGWYNVCQTVTGLNNGQMYSCDWCDSIYVQVAGGNPCNGVTFNTMVAGNAVTFQPVMPPGYVATTYSWTFGDGGTSNAASPTHTYANNGWYAPCMVVSGFTANNLPFQCTWCDSLYVGGGVQPCVAEFVFTTNGATAAFTNIANGPGVITGYNWTFGDGGTSNQPNPNHTYTTTGWYNVCLTITGIDNNVTYTCTWCDSVFVQAGGGAPCNGISFFAAGLGMTKTFAPTLPAGYVANTYSWTFGDGGTSNLANPSHTYANTGWYYVCMTVSGTNPNNQPFQCTYCDSINVVGGVQPCVAEFVFSVNGANVVFSNLANGPGVITGYNWTFGDGGTSTLPNPNHTYTTTGWYNVCLTVTGINNNQPYSCTWCDSVYVMVGGVQPCNGVGYTALGAGLTVSFAPVVPAGYVVNSYFWTFGDGGTSNIANPSHTYAVAGWYNACLTISGFTANNQPFQCNYCDSVYVIGGGVQPCIAEFVSTVSGATAAFTNMANGPGVITGYNWTFGDGGTSTLPNPTHTYANSGWYNVCLTITGIDNNVVYTCTWCDSIYIQIPGGNPCAGVSFMQSQAGNTVTFTPQMPPGYIVSMYSWTFGDGGTSNQPNPSHTYANPGWYNACMVVSGFTANNQPFQCSWCDSVFIGNNGPCIAEFIYTTSGATVNFNNQANGPGMITGYNWTFGDGGVSNQPNPSHTYSTTGWYNVCLTVTGINNGITYSCTWCDSVYVQAGGGGNCLIAANFTTNITGFNAVFNNTTTCVNCQAMNYSWNFGDGGTSNLQNPTHLYNTGGTYYVCLYVNGYDSLQNTCTDSICQYIQVGASGINEVQSQVLQVYPNPAQDHIQVSLPGKEPCELKLLDVTGKTILRTSVEGSDTYTLRTDALSKGMYHIILNSSKGRAHASFMKE